MDKYTIKKLPNGMEIIIIPNHSVETFSLCISIRVGSNDEHPSANGVSHLLEHMLYKSNHLFKTKYDLYKALDEIGANYNAYTDKNITTFFVKSDAIHQERIIHIFSNLICRPAIKSIDIENEKKVVVEEIQNTQHEPFEIIFNRFFKLNYPNDPISQIISGSITNVQNISKKEVERHLKDFYTANNMVVSMSGKIDSNIDTFLKNSFFKLAKAQFHNPGPQKPLLVPSNQCLINLVQKDLPQFHIGISFPTEGLYSQDKYPLNLIDLILNGSMSSRLFVRLREKQGLVYNITSGVSNYQEAGLYYIITMCDKDKYVETITSLLDEIKQLQEHLVQKTELDRWKNFVRSSLIMNNENSMEVADYYAREMLFSRNNITSMTEKIDYLMGVSSKQIKPVAQKILNWKKMKIVILGNLNNKNNSIIQNIKRVIKETFDT